MINKRATGYGLGRLIATPMKKVDEESGRDSLTTAWSGTLQPLSLSSAAFPAQ